MQTQSSIDDTTQALANQADALMRNGAQILSEGTDVIRDRALAVGDAAADYIRKDPVAAVLIAAVAGAALVGIVSLLSRSRR